MLLANNLVAKELIVYAGHFAFLRRHAPPDADKLREFVDWCSEMGFSSEEHPLNVGSTRNSSQLQASIEALKEGLSADDAELVEFKARCLLSLACSILECLLAEEFVVPGSLLHCKCPRGWQAVNAMRPAEYFAIGSSIDPASWRHYALAMDYYTHFTSPIRRYADIIVHRVLQAVHLCFLFCATPCVICIASSQFQPSRSSPQLILFRCLKNAEQKSVTICICRRQERQSFLPPLRKAALCNRVFVWTEKNRVATNACRLIWAEWPNRLMFATTRSVKPEMPELRAGNSFFGYFCSKNWRLAAHMFVFDDGDAICITDMRCPATGQMVTVCVPLPCPVDDCGFCYVMQVLEGIVTNDGTKYANVYLPTYGFTLPMYYDQLEMQLDAHVECVFKERIPAAAPVSGKQAGGSAESRRAQFAATSEKQPEEEEDQEEQDIQKHIVTLADGVKVEVAAMQHIRVELKANPDRVGEYSILLSYN